MTTRGALLVATALVAGAVVAGPASAQDPAQKKRVAVLDFEYQTVHQYVYDVFGSDVDIGKGIANVLVTQLVRNGTYSVIERQALDKVLQEQNFQVSGRADPSTAASLGKLLGVDAIIIGAITQFGRDDKRLGIGGGAGVGPVRLGGIGRSSSKAVVVINARIIDVQTAEILAVSEGKGESSRTGTSLYGAGIGGIAAGGEIDMGSSNFEGTIIGEATKKAVEAITGEVVAARTKIVQRKVEISGLVADVAGNDVTINVGRSAGVRVGETYDVVRPGREIRDPATGRVLRRTTTPVGTLKITDAGDTFATGILTGGPAQVGDCVGTCPVGQDPPPPPAPAPAPAAAAAPPAGPPVPAARVAATGPVVYPTGQFSWAPYQFKGTEHFRYDVTQTEDGQTQKGYYQLDLQPAGQGRVRISVAGQIGQDSYSSSVTTQVGEGMQMGFAQFMTLGPIGITLFNPVAWMFFAGHELSVGDGWSQSSGGESYSVKVESRCQHAGQGGVLSVMRENNVVKQESCIAPAVALPLRVLMNDDGNKIEMTLVQYRP